MTQSFVKQNRLPGCLSSSAPPFQSLGFCFVRIKNCHPSIVYDRRIICVSIEQWTCSRKLYICFKSKCNPFGDSSQFFSNVSYFLRYTFVGQYLVQQSFYIFKTFI